MNEVYQLGDGYNLAEMSQKQSALELSRKQKKGVFKSKKDSFYCASIVEDINGSGESYQFNGGVTVPVHGIDLTGKFGVKASHDKTHNTLYYVVHYYKVEQINRFSGNVYLVEPAKGL